jgi:hypothetical protein
VPTRKSIAKLLSEAADISQQAASVIAKGQILEGLALERQASEIRERARKAAERLAEAPADPKRTTLSSETTGARELSTRAVIVAALSEIGVPISPLAISEYSWARFGTRVDHRVLPSLRRDEWRTWSSPRSARVVYLVPALEGQRFLPVRGKLTLSDWLLERRIIGPWSERADHLAATLQIARQFAWLKRTQPSATTELRSLVAAYAATIPGALRDPQSLDPKQVEEAAQAELNVIGAKDMEWRAEAAHRARGFLNDEQLLWGAAPPQLVRRASA